MWEKGGKFMTSYECFIRLFHWVFDHSPQGMEVGEKLLTIKQGKRCVMEYALEFCILTAENGMDGTNQL